jgi:hypothetical protein
LSIISIRNPVVSKEEAAATPDIPAPTITISVNCGGELNGTRSGRNECFSVVIQDRLTPPENLIQSP